MPIKVSESWVDSVLAASVVTSQKMGEKTCVVHAVLPNGFEVVESSACVDPADYDHEVGVSIAMRRLKDRVWALEGYVRHGEVRAVPISAGVPEGAPKTLHNSDVSGARVNVPDIRVVGDGDMWQLLCKASSEREGWMKSTKALEVPGQGCLVQVTTQQRNPDGSYAVAEALHIIFARVVADENGGRKLVPIA